MNGIFSTVNLHKLLSNHIEHMPNTPLSSHNGNDRFSGRILQEIVNHTISTLLRNKLLFPLHKTVTTSSHFDRQHQEKSIINPDYTAGRWICSVEMEKGRKPTWIMATITAIFQTKGELLPWSPWIIYPKVIHLKQKKSGYLTQVQKYSLRN